MKNLTSKGYELLLALLDEDRVKAEEEYFRLRHAVLYKLAKDINPKWNVDIDLLADQAFESMAKKLEAGYIVEKDVRPLIKKIAGGLWLNYYRDKIKGKPTEEFDDHLHDKVYQIETVEDLELACMRSCFLEVCKTPEEKKALIDYCDQRDEKLKNQRKLVAKWLNISSIELKKKICELRKKLKKCKTDCMKKHESL